MENMPTDAFEVPCYCSKMTSESSHCIDWQEVVCKQKKD